MFETVFEIGCYGPEAKPPTESSDAQVSLSNDLERTIWKGSPAPGVSGYEGVSAIANKSRVCQMDICRMHM